MDKYYDVLAEVPRVRKDFGYPPLVTPTSQIVGTQAVMNVLAGERYKMVTKESKALLRGEYGRLPAPVNEEVRKKCIGDDKVITHRPADDIPPELDKYREEIRDYIPAGGGRAELRPVPAGGNQVLPVPSGQAAGCGQHHAQQGRKDHACLTGMQRDGCALSRLFFRHT